MPRVQSIQELVPLMLAASPGALRVIAHPGPQPPFQLHCMATALVSCGLVTMWLAGTFAQSFKSVGS